MSGFAHNSTEVLIAAKWMIENVGWVQGSYHSFDDAGNYTAFCAEGAVMTVDAINGRSNTLALKRLEKVMGGNAVRFNDDKKTTKQKVIRAFNKAIKAKP